MLKSVIRLRMSSHDAHYGGNLVDGARMLQLFGDVATELLILRDGDEGLFKAYDMVEFMAPVYAGDYIEAVGEIIEEGNSSRRMKFEARKVIVEMLFAEGNHHHAYQFLGAHIQTIDGITGCQFAIWCPNVLGLGNIEVP